MTPGVFPQIQLCPLFGAVPFDNTFNTPLPRAWHWSRAPHILTRQEAWLHALCHCGDFILFTKNIPETRLRNDCRNAIQRLQSWKQYCFPQARSTQVSEAYGQDPLNSAHDWDDDNGGTTMTHDQVIGLQELEFQFLNISRGMMVNMWFLLLQSQHLPIASPIHLQWASLLSLVASRGTTEGPIHLRWASFFRLAASHRTHGSNRGHNNKIHSFLMVLVGFGHCSRVPAPKQVLYTCNEQVS